MEIIRDIEKDGNFNTSLYNLLNNVSSEFLHNDEHDLRHPFSIYLLAFEKILFRLEKVLVSLKNNDNNLKSNYISFLESINEFFDDCYNIMKCFYSMDLVKGNIIFADKWLEKVDKDGIRNYKDSIYQETKITKYIVNKIKHEHGRIGGVNIETEYGICRGYFLEKYKDGALIPDEEIHLKYKKSHTAFSYVQDIIRNIASIYYVSDKVYEYLKNVVLSQDIVDCFTQYNNNNNIIEIVNQIQSFDKVLFPDEYDKSLTMIEIIDNKKLIIRRPLSYKYSIMYKRYKGFTAQLLTSGDSTTEGFAIPYI